MEVLDWHTRFIFIRDVLCLVWVANFLFWIGLQELALLCIPRTMPGLLGIFIAPILHKDLNHLAYNSLSFAFFSFLILMHGHTVYTVVTLIVLLVDGFTVWLSSPLKVPTIGASGVIYGYFSFLLVSSLLQRNIFGILILVAVLVTHCKLLQRLFLQVKGVSLTSHVAGFTGGILTALWMSKVIFV